MSLQRFSNLKSLKFAATAIVAALALTACSSSDAADSDDPIRIGVVGEENEQWPIFVEKAKEAGIDVELVNFTAYPEPNPALSTDQLDLNQFQHLQYLADYNTAADDDLTPIGSSAIYPLALYSNEYKTAQDIPDGSEIAVPNDATNLARALYVLQDAGLITLKEGAGSLATEIDIIEDESRVTVTPIAAAQTPAALQSVAASIINNDYVTDAGLDPVDAIAQDDPSSPATRPFINIWVTRDEDKDNETLNKLVEISHDAEVEAALKSQSGNTAVIVDLPAEELAGYLADIEEELNADN